MTTQNIIFTLVHLVVFFISRRFYKRKASKATAEKIKFELENVQLKTELENYKSLVDGYEFED